MWGKSEQDPRRRPTYRAQPVSAFGAVAGYAPVEATVCHCPTRIGAISRYGARSNGRSGVLKAKSAYKLPTRLSDCRAICGISR